ncbi:MAG: accessory factor UbiK family protein [Gammaproteobacteria bacterium]
MINSTLLDDLAKTLANALPPGLREMQQEMEKNFRVVLQGFFSRMDLVTREEFEVQSEVLSRTRAMVEELEKQVAELEARLPPKEDKSAAE